MMTVAEPDYKSVGVGTWWAMRRRGLWRAIGVSVFAGAAFALWRAIDQNRRLGDAGWEPQPLPFPPQPRPEPAVGARRDRWVAPVEQACPASHPVKAKLRSGIFHQPGGASYDRTIPDRCYQDATAAEADGLRRAQR
jgi:hypothetical protein